VALYARSGLSGVPRSDFILEQGKQLLPVVIELNLSRVLGWGIYACQGEDDFGRIARGLRRDAARTLMPEALVDHETSPSFRKPFRES